MWRRTRLQHSLPRRRVPLWLTRDALRTAEEFASTRRLIHLASRAARHAPMNGAGAASRAPLTCTLARTLLCERTLSAGACQRRWAAGRSGTAALASARCEHARLPHVTLWAARWGGKLSGGSACRILRDAPALALEVCQTWCEASCGGLDGRLELQACARMRVQACNPNCDPTALPVPLQTSVHALCRHGGDAGAAGDTPPQSSKTPAALWRPSTRWVATVAAARRWVCRVHGQLSGSRHLRAFKLAAAGGERACWISPTALASGSRCERV